MRILQIHFKNLNSLAGEWRIDLTHPAFVSNGIFTITGPTGAGKTTILDAVCLALYGQTPRIAKISEKSNELMSQHTGECFAEVVFETQAGTFCSHWSQQRARKKPDGKLQSPKREISEKDSGRILENRQKQVDAKIEEVTGMDFLRFTRSMLLAQGDFAAFLKAETEERIQILEQITGTEIYKEISKMVHEKCSEAEKEWKTQTLLLKNIPLLRQDEEELLNTQLAEKITLGEILEERKQRTQEMLDQLRNLDILRETLTKDQRNHAVFCETIPQKETEVSLAEMQFVQQQQVLEDRKQKRLELWETLKTVRELDMKMEAGEQDIGKTQTNLREIQRNLEQTGRNHLEKCQIRDETAALLIQTQKYLTDAKEDESLVTQLAGIRSRLDFFQKQHALRKKNQSGLQNFQKRFAEASQIFELRRADVQRVQAEMSQVQTALQKKLSERTEVLQERDLHDWRAVLSSAEKEKMLHEQLVRQMKKRTADQKMLEQLSCDEADFLKEKTSLEENLLTQTKHKESLEDALQTHEKRLSQWQQIQSLEELRKQLRDHEPCPLCGALEHPFAQGNVPHSDDVSPLMRSLKEQLKDATDMCHRIALRLAENKKDIEQTLKRRNEISIAVAQTEAEIPPDCSEELLAVQIRGDEKSLRDASAVMEQAEAVDRKTAELNMSLEKLRENADILLREQQRAEQQRASLEKDVEKTQKDLAALEKELESTRHELLNEVMAYGIHEISPDAVEEILQKLTLRQERWTHEKNNERELQRQLGTLEIQIVHKQEEMEKLSQAQAMQTERLRVLQDNQNALRNGRNILFGVKSPDAEERQANLEVKQQENGLEQSREKLALVKQEFEKIRAQAEELSRRIINRQAELQMQEKAFQPRLTGMEIIGDSIRETLEITKQKHLDEGNVLQQEIGAIRQKLDENQATRQKYQHQQELADKQNREYLRWSNLDKLIGSADGKKFSSFAQGITFDIMVTHANRQLRKMTDRYLLVRDVSDEKKLLEPAVMDNYQAGEIRSVKNLSGGESFIVSLSLALGLSQMSGENVRIESLFLDEGFDTLDEETLDSALETLAMLRQDGKLIGVISHVPMLKERISTQIKVRPVTGGGTSSLEGCGVEKIAG
ncbi:MAG: AAA family ATPase [Planctomycetaceae bacterium]|jgi:exonuclease SbcC|nr:AAA family ATPase [Planctomycetaceae bacterium]